MFHLKRKFKENEPKLFTFQQLVSGVNIYVNDFELTVTDV